MTQPLAGIRIADFTVHNAGPFCTHLLSQLGAEVIKIESAMRPDAFRKPHPVYGRMGPATFDQVASNKLSVRINLKNRDGGAPSGSWRCQTSPPRVSAPTSSTDLALAMMHCARLSRIS